MCGIFGLIGQADPQLGERIAKVMHHRGPDDHGVWADSDATPLTLVNTRLAIIDLSPAGHLPMCSTDGRLVVAYNGEIYNYMAIRTQLEQLGHHFRSQTDTEVLLAAYAEWGDDCLQRVRGMFAFLLWDKPRQRLLVARDRLGIKPLYWAQIGNTLLFGSELKALLASGYITPQLNLQAVQHYLAFYSVPTPLTMLDGVHALPPGHKLVVDAALMRHNNTVQTEAYWRLPVARPVNTPFDELRDELRARLEESVRLRMIADVPVGAFLSGGIDSSAIVGLMTRISGRPLRTFSIGFDQAGASIDERSFARIVAERYAADHTEVIVTGEQVADQLPQIVAAIDQPSGDALNTYLVSQATAQHVTVALSGVGGDELFAGYPQFHMLSQTARYDRLWRVVPPAVRRLAGNMSGFVGRAARYANADLTGRYMRLRTLFDPAMQQALLSQPVNGATHAWLGDLVEHAEPTVLDQVARWELRNYMPHVLLRDSDAMSMAHSLEVRVPLIDHELVEFVSTIPAKYKLRKGQTKVLLIEALRDVLPRAVIERPKRGFEMPVANWLRGPLRAALEEALSPAAVKARGVFHPATVTQVKDDFISGRAPSYLHAWSLTMFELWCRRYIDTGWR